MPAIRRHDVSTFEAVGADDRYTNTVNYEEFVPQPFVVPNLRGSVAAMQFNDDLLVLSGTVDVGGIVIVQSTPTNEAIVYLQGSISTNQYVDSEINTEPISRRTVYGKIINRTKAKFETD